MRTTFDGTPGEQVSGAGDSFGVIIRVRPTPARVVFGLVFMLPLLWLLAGVVRSAPYVVASPDRAADVVLWFGANLLGPLAALWFGQRFFRETQTVTVESGQLILRSRSFVGPALPKHLGMDRVSGRHFRVTSWAAPGNARRHAFRPSIVMMGDGGQPLFTLGQTLSLDEATAACDALNRFLDSPNPSPAALDDLPV